MSQASPRPTPASPWFHPLGDCGLLVTLWDAIDENGFQAVRKCHYALTHPAIEGVQEIIPGYVTLTLLYDPIRLAYAQLVDGVKERLSQVERATLPPPQVITIPVAYGGEFGPDLEFVAAHNHLSPEEVVTIHASGHYPVYMLGFTPGFPYLGGLSEKIWTPRLKSPRTRVPAGSVGIANNQTGIYPVDSPGGWQIIGRTPLTLFNPLSDQPFLIQPGQCVSFEPITPDAFYRLKGEET